MSQRESSPRPELAPCSLSGSEDTHAFEHTFAPLADSFRRPFCCVSHSLRNSTRYSVTWYWNFETRERGNEESVTCHGTAFVVFAVLLFVDLPSDSRSSRLLLPILVVPALLLSSSFRSNLVCRFFHPVFIFCPSSLVLPEC